MTTRTTEPVSQSEIDRLFGTGGRGMRTATRRNADVQAYDFRRPHRVSRERQRTLEAMYERVVKSLESALVSRLRDAIDLRLQSVEQVTFGEYIYSLSIPCSAYLIEIHKTGQQGVMDFQKELAFYLVDRLFGGSHDPQLMDRALTPIERMALSTVAERALVACAEAWHDQVRLTLSISGFESIPEIIQGIGREDPVLVANVEAKFTGGRGLLSICLPLSVLESFFSQSTDRVSKVVGSAEERAGFRSITESSLRATHVPIAVRLPDFHITLAELLDLREGTVIPLGVPANAAVTLHVGDQRRFTGTFGKANGMKAVRVDREALDVPHPPGPPHRVL
ncbi:MAG TPA: FliM/FliN family flagellar motor switch protein [Gemmatimonadaceae bacterium]|nr:FliM/FliN family flagellar motor switch protein [Gemmatimonadaceae bacterium]